MKHIPACALVWRLSVIREVILSGFQLELYTAEEKSFAYWYASQVMEAHLTCLDGLLLAVEPGSPWHIGCLLFSFLFFIIDCLAARELQFQHTFLTALQAMTLPMFAVGVYLLDS